MKITVSKLENVKEIQTISAISVYGTGFLTSIVSSFIELFGIEDKMLAKKMNKAKDRAMDLLIEQAQATPNADGIMNLNFQFSGKAVLAYGTVFNDGSGSSVSNATGGVPEI